MKTPKPSEEIPNSLTALLDFTHHVNAIESVEKAIWHMAHHTIKSQGFEDCVVYLLNDDKETLIQVAAYGPKNPKRYEISNALKLKVGQGVVGTAAKTRVSQKVADTRKNEHYVKDDQQRLSELAVPIHFRGELLGVIDSENQKTDFFTDAHQQYLEIMASILASKIAFNSTIEKLGHSYASLEKAKNLTDTYLQISELTHHSSSIEDFYSSLHQLIAKQVNTHSFFVVLYDTENCRYSCPYMHDEYTGEKFDPNVDERNMTDTLVGEVISAQKTRIAYADELKQRFKDGRMLGTGPCAQSWLAVPFQIHSSLQGAIALQSYNPNISFSSNDQEFLTFLGQHISTAISQKLKDQKLQHQALHDSTTKLANRTLFLDRIGHAFTRTGRADKPFLPCYTSTLMTLN